jgi:23S rRNA (uracil1939-C5)-methyltransferase
MPEETRLVIGPPPGFRPRSAAARADGIQLVDITVERIGAAGDGVGRWHGRPVYLPGTVPGDRVSARLGPRRGGGHSGQVIDVIAAGPGRASPCCRHFGLCGGCALQHLDPALYRRTKLDALAAALARARLEPLETAPLRSVPPARRRARLGLWRPGGRRQPAHIGFRGRFRHALVDIRECPVLETALFAAIPALRAAASGFLAPDETAEATLTRTDSGVDLLIEAAAPPRLAACEALAALAADEDLARIVWRCGGTDRLIVQNRPVSVLFAGIAVPFPPGGFLQPSAAAERLLVDEVLAGIGTRRPALDLYAGLGAFALALASGGPVHAVDGDGAVIAALAEAVRGVTQVTAECRDLARAPLSAAALKRYRAAVFDPPRAGAVRQAAALAGADLDTIVAVSCNPATFARDAALLQKGGFRLERVAPIDQFVWTPRLELAAVLRR